MPATDRVVQDAAAAIVDGTPFDWSIAESGAPNELRELLEEFRVLSRVADVHRQASWPDGGQSRAPGAPELGYWGRLRRIECIGRGSFGEVYRAWDPRLHRQVGLKLISAGPGRTSAEEIIREGRLLARVRHPGVVTIYDAEQIGDEVGLSMEFVDGPTLQQRIDDNGPFSLEETIALGVQLCDALAAVHGAGVLHRDIKAANVLMKAPGRIVLMDFGAGRQMDDEIGADVTGTPLYVAPELLAGAPASVRSDIYSLGVLLHYMVTGAYPVSAASVAELRAAHEIRRRTDAKDAGGSYRAVPAGLRRVVGRALNPIAERRHATVEALARELRALQGPPRRSRGPVAVGAALLFVLAVAAGPVATWKWAWREPVRIAILPFAIAGDGLANAGTLRQGVAGDLLARDLITRMERYRGVRVISAASVFSANVRSLPHEEIGSRLGVSAVLSGMLAQSGDRVTARARLVQVSDDRTLWSSEYSRPASEVVHLSRAIADDLERELGLTRPRGQQAIPRSPEAYALYVRGEAALASFNDGQRTAQQLFARALTIDPEYAQVHAALARVYLSMNPQLGLPGGEALRRASDSTAVALALDPALPDAHVAAAIVKSARFEWDGAEREFRRAIELGPNSVLARQEYAHWLSLHGRFEQGLEHARMAASLDPLSARAVLAVASVLRFARRYEDALVYTQRALEIDPTSAAAQLNLGHCYQGLGRLEDAIEAFQRFRRANGNLAHAYAQAGRIREARAVVELLEERFARSGVNAGEVAQAYIGLGELDRAFEWLERQQHTWPTTLKVAAVWDPLRSDQRFKMVLKTHGLE